MTVATRSPQGRKATAQAEPRKARASARVVGGWSILSHRQDAIRGPGLRPFEGTEIARRRKWTGVGLRQLERRLEACERPSVCIAEDRLRPTDSHAFDVTSR